MMTICQEQRATTQTWRGDKVLSPDAFITGVGCRELPVTGRFPSVEKLY